MKRIMNCGVVVAGLLAVNALIPRAEAKTIVVDSLNATALVRPEGHFADQARSAGFIQARSSADSRGALSGLYDEGRRFARHAAPALGEATALIAPVQQSDFPAMSLIGVILVAQQLRRRHRSLKQSLIAG